MKEQNRIPVLNKLFLILLVCFGFKTSAQVFYSVKPDYLKSKTESNNLLSEYRANYPDTSLTEFSNYFPRNFLGNMGLASPDYIWRYGTDDIGFRMVKSPLTIDRFKETDVTYYRTQGPYASLTGIAGSKQFQIFKMLFTHTYKKVNITVGFQRYTSLGFYKRQQTYTNNFYLSSNYTNKKKTFGYYLFILNNSNKNFENGGIKDGVLTDSSMIYDKSLFSVNLNGASRDNREMKFMVNPWFRLNRQDSGRSLDHYVQLKSKYETSSLRYTDSGLPSDGFYTNFFIDTVATNDSSHVRKLSNELSYSLLSTDNKFGFSAGLRNEIGQVWQFVDSNFVNNILQSDLTYRTPIAVRDSNDKRRRYFSTRLNGQYAVTGPNRNNFKLESNTLLDLDQVKKRNVFFNLLLENRSADYIYNNWVSNHFIWLNNGFGPQRQLQSKLGINLGRAFSASVFYQAISNYLYFNQNAAPAQLSKMVNNVGVSLNFTKVFFKHLGIALNHVYQKTSQTEYVRVPQNASTIKLFYSGSLSHNNLLLQIGAQLQVYQSFYALAYMPSTQVFYLQDSFKTSTYPYLDIYMNARIRPVSFFVKVENVLQSVAGPNYSFVPGYYQTDLALRFGLTWMFFD